MIISVSGCASSEIPSLDATVVHSDRPFTAGANRNRASVVATGGVLIYQDADDLPHPQRVEIIAALFENYAIDHLMHYFYHLKGSTSHFTIKEAVAASTYRADFMGETCTNGNVAVLRSVAQQVLWPEYSCIGEDQEFNRSVYGHTKRTVITPLPLITYRQNFSTFR